MKNNFLKLIFGQHRTIWQEQAARDFFTDESSESGGILCVFPTFRTAQPGKKIRWLPQTNCVVLPLLLERPVAVSKDGLGGAIGAEGVDRHAVAADHEVLMDHGIVDAKAAALLQCLILEVRNGIRGP